jgi:hypothetical protein
MEASGDAITIGDHVGSEIFIWWTFIASITRLDKLQSLD